MQETRVRFLCREEPLEEDLAAHSGVLAWRIPWTEEPGGCSPTIRCWALLSPSVVGEGLKQQMFIFPLEAGSPRSRCWKVWFLTRTFLLSFRVLTWKRGRELVSSSP